MFACVCAPVLPAAVGLTRPLATQYGISVYQMLREKREREGFDEFNEEHSGAGYVTIASNVASACRFLHDMGFLHRDLKVRRICLLGSPGACVATFHTDVACSVVFP